MVKGILLLLLGVAVVLGGFVLERVVFNASLGVQVAVGVVLALIVIAAIGYSVISALSARQRGTPSRFSAGSADDLRVGMLLTVGVVAALGIVVAFVVNLLRSAQFGIAGAVLGLGIVLLVIGTVAAVGAMRVRSLRRRYPRALVSNVAMYPQLHLQLREVSHALGVNPSELRSRRSGAMVLDDTSLRIFAGVPLRQVLALPSTAISSISIARAPQGKWMLSSLEVVFACHRRALPLDLCLMTSKFQFPHVVDRAELEKQLAQARQALAAPFQE